MLLSVCADCYQYALGVLEDPIRASEASACFDFLAGFAFDADTHAEASFSRAACDTCRSFLGGDRYKLQAYPVPVGGRFR